MDLVDEEQRPWRPLARRSRAASNTFFRSATPEKIAEICSKARLGLAGEQPRHRGLAGAGRPPEDQRAERAGARSCRVSAPSGPVRCSCPTTSASVVGRSRSASGRAARRCSEAGRPRTGRPSIVSRRRSICADQPAVALDGEAPPARSLLGEPACSVLGDGRSRSPLTSRTMSRGWKPKPAAGESRVDVDHGDALGVGCAGRAAAASRGDRSTTLAPANGLRPPIVDLGRATRLPARAPASTCDRLALALAAGRRASPSLPIGLRGQPVAERLDMLDRRRRSMASTTSPGFSPALAAGPPSATSATSAPARLVEAERLGDLRRHRLEASRRYRAARRSRCRSWPTSTTARTMLDGMAKPMPIEPPLRQ